MRIGEPSAVAELDRHQQLWVEAPPARLDDCAVGSRRRKAVVELKDDTTELARCAQGLDTRMKCAPQGVNCQSWKVADTNSKRGATTFSELSHARHLADSAWERRILYGRVAKYSEGLHVELETIWRRICPLLGVLWRRNRIGRSVHLDARHHARDMTQSIERRSAAWRKESRLGQRFVRPATKSMEHRARRPPRLAGSVRHFHVLCEICVNLFNTSFLCGFTHPRGMVTAHVHPPMRPPSTQLAPILHTQTRPHIPGPPRHAILPIPCA